MLDIPRVPRARGGFAARRSRARGARTSGRASGALTQFRVAFSGGRIDPKSRGMREVAAARLARHALGFLRGATSRVLWRVAGDLPVIEALKELAEKVD